MPQRAARWFAPAASVVVVIVAATVGLTVRAGTAAPAAPARPSVYRGRTITFDGVGAVVSAVPSGTVPRIPAARAQALFTGGVTDLVAGGGRPALHLVEYENAFTTSTGARAQVEVSKQLAWLAVSTYRSAGSPLGGPVNRPTPTAPPRPVLCHGYSAASATTGAPLDAFSICGEDPGGELEH